MQTARVCDKFGVCDDSHLDLIMNPLFLKDLYIKTGEQYKIKAKLFQNVFIAELFLSS